MSKERSMLKISTLGLLAHSVRLLSFPGSFHTEFLTIHEIAVFYIVHQLRVLFQPQLENVLIPDGGYNNEI